MSDEKHIGWMYEGAKAAVNREDYLLGKRIDKNFEKYSDAVVDEKAEGVDRVVHSRVLPSASGSASAKISSLDVNIVRTEDPLVAFKVREETRRREMMENPVMRMKMEKAIKAMMAKKLGSGAKKEKRKKKKKHSKKGSRDSSSDSDDEEPSKKKTKKDKTHKAERKQSESKKHSSSESESQSTVEESSKRVKERRKSHSHEASVRRDRNGDDRRHYHKRSHHSRESTHTDKRRSSSRSRSPFVQSRSRSRHDSVDKKEGRYRRDRQSPECSEGRRRQSGHRRERDSSSESDNKQRSYGMELPQHPHNSRSSSRSASHSPRFDREESERKKRFEGYGLVGVVKKKTDDNEESTSTDNPYKLQKLPAAAPYQKSSRTRPLTEREKEEKLREMQENAKWRTDQRSKNLRKAEEADIEEDLEDDRAKPASFIRPMMNSANEGMSVEQRLKANKKGLQRDHGYMERSFTKR